MDHASRPLAAANDLDPRPRTRTVFVPVDEGAVVFSEESQNLFSLDALASYVWLALGDGQPVVAIVHALAEAARTGEEPARARIEATIDLLREAGLLEDGTVPTPATAPDEPEPAVAVPPGLEAALAATHSAVVVEIMGRRIRLRFGSEDLDNRLRPIVAPIETGPDRDIPVGAEIAFATVDGQCYAARDGAVTAVTSDEVSLAALFEGQVYRAVLQDVDYLLTIHCGAVAVETDREGTTWLALPAASGSGKTTLTTALAAAGYPYGSDELLMIGRDLRARPMSIPPCIKEKSWPVLAERVPGLMEAPVHARYGEAVRYPPVAPFRDGPALPVAAFVFPKYVEDGETTLRPLSKIAGMQRLFDQCLSIPRPLQLDTARELVEQCARTPFYELELSDLDVAIGLLRGLAPPAVR